MNRDEAIALIKKAEPNIRALKRMAARLPA
jgi:hypothetical protein